MSTGHGGPVQQKSISEIAEYLKRMIPETIPKTYALKPVFHQIGSEKDIHKGVIAYRDFLIVLLEKLISEGHDYFKLKGKPGHAADYPFLYQITDLLADIGYHGEFIKDENLLRIKRLPSFLSYTDENGIQHKARNSVSKLTECIGFLKICGFELTGIDTDAKKKDIAENLSIDLFYPSDPIMLTGLKVMSIADIELREKRYRNDHNHDNLLRCDYRLLKSEESDALEYLTDFLIPLPEKVREFALTLHRHFMKSGMICTTIISTFDAHFAYSYIKNPNKVLSPKNIYEKRIWEFSLSVRDDYSLIVRAKKTDKYPDVIQGFAPILQDKISRGYGCDRKLFNEPCRNGCRGICLPLDESIVCLAEDIQLWLDHELKN